MTISVNVRFTKIFHKTKHEETKELISMKNSYFLLISFTILGKGKNVIPPPKDDVNHLYLLHSYYCSIQKLLVKKYLLRSNKLLRINKKNNIRTE